jgi:transposase InsO family protein
MNWRGCQHRYYGMDWTTQESGFKSWRMPIFFRCPHCRDWLLGPSRQSIRGWSYTRCSEVVPIPDISADTVARALLTGWISRFGCPQTITTDHARQFESQLFLSLAKLCGIQLSRTTAHHPAANGLVECFQRTLNAAIMCHADQHWTEVLSLVLLGIRTALKVHLQASVSELVYGEPLRIPGELLAPTISAWKPPTVNRALSNHKQTTSQS